MIGYPGFQQVLKFQMMAKVGLFLSCAWLITEVNNNKAAMLRIFFMFEFEWSKLVFKANNCVYNL